MLKINELLNKSSNVVSSIASITLGLAVTAYAALILKKSCKKLFSKSEVATVALADTDLEQQILQIKTPDKKTSSKKKTSKSKQEEEIK